MANEPDRKIARAQKDAIRAMRALSPIERGPVLIRLVRIWAAGFVTIGGIPGAQEAMSKGIVENFAKQVLDGLPKMIEETRAAHPEMVALAEKLHTGEVEH